MGSIIGSLVGKTIFGRTITEPIARFIATAGLVLILIAAVGGLWAAVKHDVISSHDAKAELKTEQKIAPATNNAATARANDTILITQNETEAHNAIHSVPDAAPAAPSVRLGCERLRRSGKDVSRLPACAGYSSGR